MIVAPDAGALVATRALAKKINCSRIAIIDKRRPTDNESEVIHVVGVEYFEGAKKIALFIDDMVDTASTLVKGAAAINEKGAREIYSAVTHPVLSGPAIERLNESVIKKLFVGDTIPLSQEKRIDKIIAVSLIKFVAKAVYLIHNEDSVSQLFNQPIDLAKL